MFTSAFQKSNAASASLKVQRRVCGACRVQGLCRCCTQGVHLACPQDQILQDPAIATMVKLSSHKSQHRLPKRPQTTSNCRVQAALDHVFVRNTLVMLLKPTQRQLRTKPLRYLFGYWTTSKSALAKFWSSLIMCKEITRGSGSLTFSIPPDLSKVVFIHGV